MSHDAQTLAAIVPLRTAGFALQWLHPRQKRPIGKEWQNAPIASIEGLRATHAAGNNLGVRLGEPSCLSDGNYLHVIDMDIRFADLADETWARLREILPVDPDTLPMVESGSGGESRHLYFTSDKPFFSRKLAVSDGKHRDAEGKWHHDWEIELFGTGKQVAMPPSIHPDTGRAYRWVREFDFFALSLDDGPFIPSTAIEALGAVHTVTYDFESRKPLEFKPDQMERILADVPISDLHYDDWIILGQALHHQMGGSDAGFALWLEHSRRSKKYDGDDRTMRRKYRSFGKNRRQPVTMATVVQWAQEVRAAALSDQFEDLPDEPATDFDSLLGDDEIDFDSMLSDDDNEDFDSAPADEAVAGVSWTSLLDLTEDGPPKGCLHNVELILKNDPRFKGLARFNEFTQEVVQRGEPGTKAVRANAKKPTKQLSGPVWKVKDTVNGDLWKEVQDTAIRSVIEAPKTQGGYGIKITDRDLRGALDTVSRDGSFHPVREFLSAVVWDGVPRVETLFVDYLGAAPTPYVQQVACMMMIAAVARIFEPGHKFDFAVILEGVQGKRKSTFIEVLAKDWFAELSGDFHDPKSMVESMQGSWIMEIGELSGFSRADVRTIKAFITRTTDKVRLAYDRRAGEFPRQCIFIGSTNDDQYLKDDTGGRRFWPIACMLLGMLEIDTDRLRANVDQLWAEAHAMYRAMRAAQPYGTLPLFLSEADARAEAEALQEERRAENIEDVLAGKISEWLDQPVRSGDIDEELPTLRMETCSAQIWVECLGKDLAAFKPAEQSVVGRALRKVPGWGPTGTQHRFASYGLQRLFMRGGKMGLSRRIGADGKQIPLTRHRIVREGYK